MEKKHVYGIGGAVVIGVVGIIILIATSLKTLQSDESKINITLTQDHLANEPSSVRCSKVRG